MVAGFHSPMDRCVSHGLRATQVPGIKSKRHWLSVYLFFAGFFAVFFTAFVAAFFFDAALARLVFALAEP